MTKEKLVVEEVVTRSKEQSTPVLLKFQNGDLTTTHKNSTLYFQVQSDEDKKKRAVVIASSNVYSGPIGGSQADELTDTYICVRNKDTNKVRIVPVDQVKLINHVYEEKEKTKFGSLTKENSFRTMIRNFGGRRDMRYLANQQRNQVSIDVVKDQLDSTVDESHLLDTSEPVISAEHNVERIRPPFNKEATSLDNVFNLYDVIPLELIDRLDEEATALMTTDIEDIPIASEFLQSAIKTLKSKPQSSQTLLKLKVIIYMDGLQSLIKTRAKSLKRVELSKITEKVENDIRQRFTDENSTNNLRTSFSNEKALCHFLVLAFLLSDNYELDINVLSLELRTAKKRILEFGHLVNAKLKSRTNILALKLPSSIKPMSFKFVGNRPKK